MLIVIKNHLLWYYCFSEKQKSLLSSLHKENEELSNLLNESEVQDMVK